jgi:hypothetical protein
METNTHSFYHISLSSLLNEKCFRQSCRENRKTRLVWSRTLKKNRVAYEMI